LYVVIQVIGKLELKLLIIELIDIFIEDHYVMLLIFNMIYEVLLFIVIIMRHTAFVVENFGAIVVAVVVVELLVDLIVICLIN
jgi:hypothetical protein